MVFFTCNKCGESLKKKDVEKHCNTRCRGPPFLTCVDCLKDFREDFVKHTACVTEDDRYSAMGLKGLQSKQKSKQQLWVETVQNCVSRAIDDGVPGITPSIRSLLLYLQEQASLPDKPKPFANFVKNARRSEPPQNIEFVWKILEEARLDLQAKQKAEREAAEAERKKAKEQQKQNKVESSESSSDDSDSSDSETDKGQKNGAVSKSGNSSKHNSPNEDIVNGGKDKKKKRMISESSEAMANATGLQKVKKKKRNPESESQDNENTANLKDAMDACHLNAQTSSSEDQKLTKKERKEKKKRGKYEAELKEIESTELGDEASCMEVQEEAPEADTDGKKNKKKKNKKKSAEDSNAEGETETQSKEERKKDKKNKKRGKHDENEEIDESSNTGKKNGKQENGKLNATLNLDEQEKTKFSWDTVILQVLESQSDKEISFKRLSKKVVGEYLNSLGDDAHFDEARIMNKFQKRLEKMHNVVFYKDKVKLKTSRD